MGCNKEVCELERQTDTSEGCQQSFSEAGGACTEFSRAVMFGF